MHGDADSKAEVFLNRYTAIYQRLIRHDLFRPAVVQRKPTLQQGVKFQLKPVEYLLASASTVGDLVVFGMLTQLKEVTNATVLFFDTRMNIPFRKFLSILFQGVYYLEDPTGAVKLDLSEAISF